MPLLKSETLQALATALRDDDPRLVQGYTVLPRPIPGYGDRQVAEAACLLGFCAWREGDLRTPGEVDDGFAELCFKIERLTKNNNDGRHLTCFFDVSPRLVVRRELLREIESELVSRLGVG